MSIYFFHFFWLVVFMVLSFVFLLLSMWVTMSDVVLSFSVDLFSSWFFPLTLSFSVDLFSSWFSFTVTFISAVIMIYSYFYMMPYQKVTYFVYLTILFVLSMLAVINMTNFFFMMLGWDGLGLVSFFLIVYYQNFSSLYSGLFTVLTNRMGDCFFIVSISLMALNFSVFWNSIVDFSSSKIIIVSAMMILAFSTKSAIYPFSSWLPMAMAAPTPISALVHSSTLVTAGLYLMMRFYYLFYLNSVFMTFILILCVFTSFYAGLNSVFETDMKKLIALSTLSHLGFIGMAFSSGLLYLSFFHLLVHALFKSVLFMAMGDIMTNLGHSQDIRFLSSGLTMTPFSFSVMMVSILNLLGLPSLSGFFSKDMILESLNFSFISFVLVFLVYSNLVFTYYYSYKLFYYSFSVTKTSCYNLIVASSFYHSLAMIILVLFGVVFGFFWLNYIVVWSIHVLVPPTAKLFPYVLNFSILVCFIVLLEPFTLKHFKPTYYFSTMMFLFPIMMTLSSRVFLKTSFEVSKSLEFGVFNEFLNDKTSKAASFMGMVALKTLTSSSIFLIFLFSSFLFVYLCFLLDNMMIMCNC